MEKDEGLGDEGAGPEKGEERPWVSAAGKRLNLSGERGPEKKRLRARHDGFTPARQKVFLKTLRETGCVRDACRVAGITSTSAYRARRKLPGLRRMWDDALAMASSDLEAIAYRRAVEGAEEKVIRDGKVVQTKIKPSDSMLRLIVEGSNPEKYGRRGTVAKQLAREDEKLRAELEADIWAEMTTEEEMAACRARIIEKMDAIKRHELREGRYFEAYPGGPLIPAGWRPPEGFAPGEWREPGSGE